VGRETFGLKHDDFLRQPKPIISHRPTVIRDGPDTGSMAARCPAHIVEVGDDEGIPVPPGTTGTIRGEAPDPFSFLRYWNKPKPRREFKNGWLSSGGHRQPRRQGEFLVPRPQ